MGLNGVSFELTSAFARWSPDSGNVAAAFCLGVAEAGPWMRPWRANALEGRPVTVSGTRSALTLDGPDEAIRAFGTELGERFRDAAAAVPHEPGRVPTLVRGRPELGLVEVRLVFGHRAEYMPTFGRRGEITLRDRRGRLVGVAVTHADAGWELSAIEPSRQPKGLRDRLSHEWKRGPAPDRTATEPPYGEDLVADLRESAPTLGDVVDGLREAFVWSRHTGWLVPEPHWMLVPRRPKAPKRVPDTPTVVDLTCAVCGTAVGSYELYPPGVPRPTERGGDSHARAGRRDRPWLYATPGRGQVDLELMPEEYELACQALRGWQAGAFHRLYCRPCGLAYCHAHWVVDGSHGPFASCPRGHTGPDVEGVD